MATYSRKYDFIVALTASLALSLVGAYAISLALGRVNTPHPNWQLGVLLKIGVALALNAALFAALRARQRSESRAKRLAQQAHALRFARRDPLTGLASQHLLSESIASRLVDGGSVSLLLAQLSEFGTFRALHGYDVGDDILVAVGQRMLALAAGDRRHAARLDGETFAVLMESDDRVLVEAMALRLQRALAEPYTAAGQTFDLTFRIGIAIAPEHAASTDELTRFAQTALEAARSSGAKSWLYYDPAMKRACEAALQLRHDLPGAITSGQIVPYYQPIVDLKTRRWVKMEVLARWFHPTLGRIDPDRFIPIAEELQMTGAITDALLNRVAFDAAHFPDDIVFAFNVSPEQLRGMIKFADPGRPRPEGALPLRRLEVEITERALIEDLDVAREVIRALQAAGIAVALDDFGVGYSNFFHLCELPFDSIKVDKKFVLNMLHDRRAAACVGAMVLTGRSLGIEMVAEGIETEPALEALQDLGYRLGQGYLFGRPAPAADFIAARPAALRVPAE